MKKIIFVIAGAVSLALTGCSVEKLSQLCEEKMEECILQVSNITEKDSYRQYAELRDGGKLDESGCYNELSEYGEEYAADKETADNPAAAEKTAKQVHVTFAENNYLEVNYYYDADLREAIEGEECYLDIGESIYASQPECTNPYMNAYVFSEFRIYEYDQNGNRSKNLSMASSKKTVLTIPEGFTGTELSVEPVGEYRKPIVAFEAYTIDKNGCHREVLGGTWEINGERYTDATAEIRPSDAYLVKYLYDQNKYYLVDSEPGNFSDNNGVVEFHKTASLNEAVYSVQLSPYCSLRIEGDDDAIESITAVKLNGKEYYDTYPIENTVMERLKAGDEVYIETRDGYRLFSTQIAGADIRDEVFGKGDCKFSFAVPKSGQEIEIRISKSELKVDVADSVGNEILFDIEASGASIADLVYKKQRFSRDCTIFEGAVGADEPILIKAKSGVLSEGQALRFDITREDSNGKKTEETSYISELPGTQSILAYKNGQPDNFGKVCKSIEVRVSLVETGIYRQENIEHAWVEVRLEDEEQDAEDGGTDSENGGQGLKDGEEVELSRKVRVTIRPQEGYYISGKKVSDDIYTAEMTFEEYCSDIKELLKSHPVKKYIQVTLDTGDPYGSCTYKIGKQKIENTEKRSLKEGDEITLEYVLKNPDYQIVKESKGFVGGIVDWITNIGDTNKENEESVSIEITAEMDGTVIKRQSYITVEKK